MNVLVVDHDIVRHVLNARGNQTIPLGILIGAFAPLDLGLYYLVLCVQVLGVDVNGKVFPFIQVRNKVKLLIILCPICEETSIDRCTVSCFDRVLEIPAEFSLADSGWLNLNGVLIV